MSDMNTKAMAAICDHVLGDHDDAKTHVVDGMIIRFVDHDGAWAVSIADGSAQIITVKEMLQFCAERGREAREDDGREEAGVERFERIWGAIVSRLPVEDRFVLPAIQGLITALAHPQPVPGS